MQTVFGVEMVSVLSGGQSIADAGANWVRRNGMLWNDIEPTEGLRNWAAAASLESELIEASRLGLNVILVVRSAPVWARKYANSQCGPIRSDKMAAFGRFMNAAVARYSQPPYNVKYWQIGNEPDGYIAPDAGADQVFGCWADVNDVAHAGGGDYARTLQNVYPQIKAADPRAEVIVGGMMIMCDADNPVEGYDCRNAKFFEGVLANGGGPYFDGVAFHAYDYFWGNVGDYDQDGWRSRANTTGPVMITKARYFKSVMARYNVSGKRLYATEAALICGGCGAKDAQAMEATKANYVSQLFGAAIAEGITALTWYSLEGWRGSHLISSGVESQAFTAFRVARRKLGAATFLGSLTRADVGPNASVLGYKFRRDGRDVWLLWSRDGSTQRVLFPTLPSAITNAAGVVSPLTQYLDVSYTPMFIEW